MKVTEFEKRMQKLTNPNKEQQLECAMSMVKEIQATYHNPSIGVEQSEYFLSGISALCLVYPIDRTYVKLFGNTYKEGPLEERQMQRRFLLNSNVIQAGSEYAESILRIIKGKEKKSQRLHAYVVFSQEKIIEDYRLAFSSQEEIHPFESDDFDVRPYVIKRKRKN